jgi:aspartate/tyrosine/aromatic aminotransferase
MQDVVFNSIEEMEEALRNLRTDMTEEFDDVGMNEFDQIVKQNGGFPKNIAAGEKIFAIAQKVRAELKQLHKKS